MDFKLIEGDTAPLEVEVWKFNYILDTMNPTPQFVNFFRQSYKYFKNDHRTLRDDKIGGLINYFWRVSKTVKLYYLCLVVLTYLV